MLGIGKPRIRSNGTEFECRCKDFIGYGATVKEAYISWAKAVMVGNLIRMSPENKARCFP
jgi:hypothetical protein